mmetsp:Transcript_56686/g.165875  ORF Transcript_56686/g.165875 Transcript_56686/m.165875 type:complete len:340 (+) Transcript_56686:530-1549(+)
MPKWDAHISQDSRVSEVALQSAHGQLLRQVLKDRIGHAKIALSILKVNWINLVRHGTGPNFSSHDLLLEVLHGDIHPHVPAQVNKDGVDPFHRIEDGAHVVVVLDLCGVLLPSETKVRLAECICEGPPIDVWVCHQVCVHVPSGTSKLAAVWHLAQECKLPFHALDEYLELFGKVRRRGGLAVSLGQHWEVPLCQSLLQRRHELLHTRDVALLKGFLQEQWGRGVVDVLAGESKVHVLLVRLQAQRVELLLDEVLHSLDIMIGDLLCGLDFGGISNAHISSHSTQLRSRIRWEVFTGWQPLHQCDEIFNLDVHSIPDEAILREVLRERLCVAPISAIYR